MCYTIWYMSIDKLKTDPWDDEWAVHEKEQEDTLDDYLDDDDE